MKKFAVVFFAIANLSFSSIAMARGETIYPKKTFEAESKGQDCVYFWSTKSYAYCVPWSELKILKQAIRAKQPVCLTNDGDVPVFAMGGATKIKKGACSID